MNMFEHLRGEVEAVVAALANCGVVPEGLDLSRLSVDPPRQAGHGDVATNAAMVLAKPAAMKPRELAEKIAGGLRKLDQIAAAEVAGPGFINLTLEGSFWSDRLIEILSAGTAYGDSNVGKGEKINVEYVSANPTGPLHVGHGRGAVFGDVLAALLEKAGFAVAREYYVNDAGAQVDALARSLHARYLVAAGEKDSQTLQKMISEGVIEYGGDYLRPVAEAIWERDGGKWLGKAEEEWLTAFRRTAIEEMLLLIGEDLKALGVGPMVFVSERELIERGAVADALKVLEDQGLIYTGVLEPPKGKMPDDWQPRPQMLFKATEFGDDVDRALKKSDGGGTYFASDIAYHLDKFKRGFASMVNVWGADHGGYVKRLRAAVKALTEGKGDLDVKLYQMVNLLDNGRPVKMSKRAGTFVALREVIDRVGGDVMRFIMMTRGNDAHLDFDLARVTEQSRDNPVFYVQYAHARARSVMRHAAEEFGACDIEAAMLAKADLGLLRDPAETDLIRALAGWPRTVVTAALAHEPHRVAFYLGEVAARFHALWNKGRDDSKLRFILGDKRDLTMARLALVQGVAFVVASGLIVLGVEPVEEMR
jgi:arginyl-tRNA synthetase